MFPPACCAQMCVTRKGRVGVSEGDAGAAAGFRRVSGAFAASCTGQLAAIEDKMHIFSTPIPIYSSSNPLFLAQQPAAA